MGHVSTVLALHGAARDVVRDRFEFQNMTDREVLRRYLVALPPLVPLEVALAGNGVALTIDDATRAAADAALIARDLGHHVSVFINPEQVESGSPYWFGLLHCLLDRLAPVSRELDGVIYPTRTRAERRALREPIKAACRAMRTEAARAAHVAALAGRWDVLLLSVPEHLRTLTIAELMELRDAGVEIQNHGWSHMDHAYLTAAESEMEIRRGRDWIHGTLGVDAAHFAVPFGDVRPAAGLRMEASSWLTLHDGWPPGPLGPDSWNRVEPVMPAAGPAGPAAPVTGLRAMAARLRRRFRR